MRSNSLERDASQLTRNIDRINEVSLDLPRLLQRAELAGGMGVGQETVDSIDGKRSPNINQKARWQNRSENSAIGEFSRFRFRADKLTTPLFALWRVIAWRRRIDTRVDIAMVIVRTVLVLVIVVHLKTASTIRLMRTHGGGIGVMVMQAASKHNVRTKCDERQAMNGASKHGAKFSEGMGGGLFAVRVTESISSEIRITRSRSTKMLRPTSAVHAPCQLAREDKSVGTSE